MDAYDPGLEELQFLHEVSEDRRAMEGPPPAEPATPPLPEARMFPHGVLTRGPAPQALGGFVAFVFFVDFFLGIALS